MSKKEEAILNRAGKVIQGKLREQLRTQGHTLTGQLEKSIVSRVIIDSGATVLEGVALSYAGILDAGVTVARIPFSAGSGARHSKYIEALIRYFRLRGLDEKESKSAAFATAKVQKREGMSTIASHRFSKDGTREYFIELTDIALGKTIDEIVMPGLDDLIENEFNKTKSETI